MIFSLQLNGWFLDHFRNVERYRHYAQAGVMVGTDRSVTAERAVAWAAAFADRYDAMQRYGAVRTGAVDVEGGWRVYSSGRARSADSRLTRTARVGW